VAAYGVAAVYTPPEKRGKGYASHMLRLLHWVLAPRTSLPSFPLLEWGASPAESLLAGDARFSYLGSDLGDFYRTIGPTKETIGWDVIQPNSIVWPISRFIPGSTVNDAEIAWRWLDEASALKIWDADAQLMKEEVKSTAVSEGEVLLAILPNKGIAAAQHRRVQFYLTEQVVPKPYMIPTFLGVHVTSPSSSSLSEESFITWVVDIGIAKKPLTLIITRLRFSSQASLDILLNKAIEVAKECGLEQVELWDPSKALEKVAASYGGVIELCQDMTNCLKWYGDTETGHHNVHWLYNEKCAPPLY
jgi:hypothetical protein